MVAILQPSANLIPVDINNPLFHIESAGRTCYKSEDRMTSDSAKKFVEMIFGIGHLSVIEHLALVWKINKGRLFTPYLSMFLLMGAEQVQITEHKDFYLISMNLRSLFEMRHSSSEVYPHLINPLREQSFMFIFNAENKQYFLSNSPVEFIGYAGAQSTWDKLMDLAKEINNISVLQHIWLTMRLITDRGVTHELVRHRPPSYSQESTRFCNYGKDKFGNQISVIEPPGLTVDQKRLWFEACETAERIYLDMIKDGITPQIARSVLPNCLKTEIVVTTHLKEWQYIFQMRLWNKKAHPQMRELMQLTYNALNETLPAVFPQRSIHEEQ